MLAALMLCVAFAIRSLQFGNPLIHVDENFYLLVGDRMLHGNIPFVDIWDRKPIGLFLIFAAIRLLGGVGIVQYQIVATLFVAATAFFVALVARRIASAGAACVSGVLYVLLLGLAGGTGGQAPVFYNLPVAIAALAVLTAWTDETPAPRRVRCLGLIAMAAIGLAMQIKYTVVFEGMFLGLALAAIMVRASGGPIAALPTVAGWIAMASAPTLAAIGVYAWLGHLDAFLYANFLSIGARSGDGGDAALKRLGKTWIALHIPVFAVVLATLVGPWRSMPGGARAFAFVMAWLGAAVFGYAIFGSYFDHYALPLMLPISVACAPLFACRRHHVGAIAAILMLAAGAIAYKGAVARNQGKGGTRAMAAMLVAIEPRKDRGLFVYDGDTILYYLTGTLPPTRYVFSSHLTLRREAGAIGTDPLDELRRILATRPGVVVDAVEKSETEENPRANDLVRTTLRRRYRPVATVAQGKRTVLIYERLPGM